MTRFASMSMVGLLVLSVASTRGQTADSTNSTVPAAGFVSSPSEGTTTVPTAEERITQLEGKLKELSKHLTVTTAGEQVKVILGGTISADMLFNTKRPIAPGIPFLLGPGPAGEQNQYTFDGNARQTSFYSQLIGPTICGDWQTGAFTLITLYDNSVIADRYGLLPINAFGEMRNQDWRLSAGLQNDIFSAMKPGMLFALSNLAGAGNPGAVRLNAQATRFVHWSDESQIKATLGISEPTTTIINGASQTLVEDNGWPNVEGRLAIELGPLTGDGPMAVRPVEFGVSGVVGQLRRTILFQNRSVINVWGISGEARAALSDRFGMKGEVYYGQALGEYCGGIFQSIGDDDRAVRSVGGWCEVYYYLCPETLHTHVGYGIDAPNDGNLGPIRPIRNDAIFANLIWDPTKQTRIAFEVTYRKTDYLALPDNRGWGFQTQFQFRF